MKAGNSYLLSEDVIILNANCCFSLGTNLHFAERKVVKETATHSISSFKVQSSLKKPSKQIQPVSKWAVPTIQHEIKVRPSLSISTRQASSFETVT